MEIIFPVPCIPEEIGLLRHLIIVQLLSNNLSGEIPASIGKMTNLSILTLTYNKLFGSISTTIGEMASLSFLELSGSIPTTIAKFDQAHLFRFDK